MNLLLNLKKVPSFMTRLLSSVFLISPKLKKKTNVFAVLANMEKTTITLTSPHSWNDLNLRVAQPHFHSAEETLLSFRLGALNSLSFVFGCARCTSPAPFNKFSKFLKYPKMLKKPSKSTLDQSNLLNLLWCFARFARTYSHSGNTLCNLRVVWLGRRAQPERINTTVELVSSCS